MGIKKEKTFIKIGLITLFCIVLTTIFIQISDSYITAWEYKILKSQNRFNNTLSIVNNLQDQKLFYTMLEIIDPDKVISLTGENSQYLQPKLKAVNDRFRNKQISQKEYFKQFKIIAGEEHAKYYEQYNIEITTANTLIRNKPKFIGIKWSLIKRILVIIQIIAIFILMYFYVQLYSSIGKRYYTGIENKCNRLDEENKQLKESISQMKNKLRK